QSPRGSSFMCPKGGGTPMTPPPLSPGPPPTFRCLMNSQLHFSPFILALIHPLHSPHISPPLLPPPPPSRLRPSLLRFRILFRTAALSCHSLSSQPFLAIGRTITVPSVRLRSSG
ncbi:hypothetical protein, partial [Duncaniella freteri]|uniref:hypothetical protein n=3 Tax=Duncaniella TaxID=2518495 RepID=UPI00258FB6E5